MEIVAGEDLLYGDVLTLRPDLMIYRADAKTNELVVGMARHNITQGEHIVPEKDVLPYGDNLTALYLMETKS